MTVLSFRPVRPIIDVSQRTSDLAARLEALLASAGITFEQRDSEIVIIVPGHQPKPMTHERLAAILSQHAEFGTWKREDAPAGRTTWVSETGFDSGMSVATICMIIVAALFAAALPMKML